MITKNYDSFPKFARIKNKFFRLLDKGELIKPTDVWSLSKGFKTESDLSKESISVINCPYVGSHPLYREIASVDLGDLKALVTLLMCSDPWPVIDDSGNSESENEVRVKDFVNRLCLKQGFTDWFDAYHVLTATNCTKED